MTDAERAKVTAECWRLAAMTEALLTQRARLVGREPAPEPPLAKVLEFRPRSA